MFKAVLIRILILVTLVSVYIYIAANSANARDFGELKELYVDYTNFGYLNKDERNPVIYPTPPSTGLNFGETMDLFWGYGYLDAEIQSLTDTAQFREVGLQYRLGARPFKWLEFGIWHLSQHNLDRDPPIGYYPFMTGLEVKIWLFRK